MIIDLEIHPKWSPEWDIPKREKATLALCTHLMNSKLHSLHTVYGFATAILSAVPVHVLGNESYNAADKILLRLEIDEIEEG